MIEIFNKGRITRVVQGPGMSTCVGLLVIACTSTHGVMLYTRCLGIGGTILGVKILPSEFHRCFGTIRGFVALSS
jgi:hypothetical protein